MKFLNIGCGSHFSINREWINIDFVSAGDGVIAHNLLKGIPFDDNTFDLVYHSHVLEHFNKEDGEKLIGECFRVLKPGGVIRIAVPDLEKIVKNYIIFLEAGLIDPADEMTRANYDWMLLEMYDQTVRAYSGGSMAKYLFQDIIKNEEFVYERIGEEGKSLRSSFLKSKESKSLNSSQGIKKTGSRNFILKLKSSIKSYLIKKLKVDEKAMNIGKFRLGGEIHQWMYDRYSLYVILKNGGGNNIQIKDAFSSFVSNWDEYNLDGKAGIIRKPDSLFMEAIK